MYVCEQNVCADGMLNKNSAKLKQYYYSMQNF